MAVDDPVLLTCAISGAVANRDQCPAIPYTPAEYAAEARRAVDEGASMIHIHARTPDGTPSYEVEDFRAITEAIRGRGRRRRQLLDGRDRRAGREAGRLPARAPARRRGAEHGLDELREVLAPPARLRVLDGLRQPVRGDRRAAGGDERARHQARARVLRPRPRRLARAARAQGRAAPAAARLVRDGRARRRAADRAQPGRDGRQHPGRQPLGGDRDRAARSGRWSPPRSRSAARCASGSRTTSTCRTARWRAPTATSWRARAAHGRGRRPARGDGRGGARRLHRGAA